MSSETINISGVKSMSVQVGGAFDPGVPDNVTVNLAAHSEWIGAFSQYPMGHLTVKGTGTFDATGSSNADGTTTIGVNVIGNGTINEWQGHSSGKLEFAHSVANTVTVTDSGYEFYAGEFGVVQIDSPLNYHAATQLGYGEIILEGLKATSYSLKNDLLSIFNGKSVVDTMNLSVQTVGVGNPTDFGVSQVGGSVVIHADGSSYHDGGKLLAMHG